MGKWGTVCYCVACWNQKNPDRPWIGKVLGDYDVCGICGNLTMSGIYVRGELTGTIQRDIDEVVVEHDCVNHPTTVATSFIHNMETDTVADYLCDDCAIIHAHHQNN